MMVLSSNKENNGGKLVPQTKLPQLCLLPQRLLGGAVVWALRPAQPMLVNRNKQPILSRGSGRRCACGLLLVRACGHSYSTVAAATPSSDAPVFLLSLPQARPGNQRYNWELDRLCSLPLVGSQTENSDYKHPLSCGRLGREKGYGSKRRQKVRIGAPKEVIWQLLASSGSSCSQAGAKRRALHSFGSH